MNHLIETPPILLSPISKLTRDILWLIFTINADMFDPLESTWQQSKHPPKHMTLDTTLATSHVCSVWRDLLLKASSIWGRTLRIERLGSLGDCGRAEVVRRTGKAPLHIMGNLDTEDEFNRDFFDPFLRENWPRVEKICIFLVDSSTEPLSHIFLLPAPSMQFFNLQFGNTSDTITFSPLDVLFSRDAPLLRQLEISGHIFPLSLQTHWAPHLRSLDLTIYAAAMDVLNAIKQMPYLQFLSLEYLSGDIGLRDPDPESILLPNLTQLHLFLAYHVALAFARGIKPASDCTLRLISKRSSTHPPNFHATTEMLSRYVKRYFALRNVSSLAVTISESLFSIATLQVTDYPAHPMHQSPPFIFSLGPAQFGYFSDSASLITPFLKCDFSKVTYLDLTWSISNDTTPWIDIGPFLQTLSPTLEEIVATAPGLRLLTQCTEDGSECFLPHLHTLQYRFFPTGEFITNFRNFYISRNAHHIPIRVLDLGNDPEGEWTFLEGATGLKVVWRVDGEQSEYICGSGDLSILDFGYYEPESDDESSSE